LLHAKCSNGSSHKGRPDRRISASAISGNGQGGGNHYGGSQAGEQGADTVMTALAVTASILRVRRRVSWVARSA